MRALFVSALAALFAVALTPSSALAEGDNGPRVAPGAIVPSRTVRSVPRVAEGTPRTGGECVGGQCGVPAPTSAFAFPAASGSASDPGLPTPAPAAFPAPTAQRPVARTPAAATTAPRAYVPQPVSSGRTYRVPPPPPPPAIAADGTILRRPVPPTSGMVAPVRVPAPQVARSAAPPPPVRQATAPVRRPVPQPTYTAPAPQPVRTAAAPRPYVRPARTYALPSECKT
jgi:hypothetical protein